MKCLGRNRTLMKQKVWRTPSPSNQSFRWMAGVYYLDTKRFISTSTGDDNLQGIVTVKRQPPFGNLANQTLSFLADNNPNDRTSVVEGKSVTESVDHGGR